VSASEAGAGGTHAVTIPLASSRIAVDLDLEQRRKGLLWYNLYDVRFAARYGVRNTGRSDHLTLHFLLPSTNATYANFTVTIGGRRVTEAAATTGAVAFDLAPGASTEVDVGYQSRGIGSWIYRFGNGASAVNDFALAMTTNFDAIGFPSQTLLPVAERRTAGGWQLNWRYSTLLTGNGIGMTFPSPLQPGPLAQRLTFWAPVALLFYFFVMLVVTKMRGVELHPVNYFFLACAFFAFHLLFAYLVDRIAVEAAFAICSVVSIFLTISYLRLVAGWRFAAVESGLAQLVYLVLFSFALFNEGWSGLTITVGAILTLFVMMQLTGRIRWSERFA
ncbi:MAG TPA: inner membrane CreD family protein, partial [Candidatus Tumulicola sp.]|nr:inner membrane CreD family protein [Candidatus Tumulicola sp.]